MFITFEGIDGTGKSTQAHLLKQRLEAVGRDVVLTREPGGSPGAEEIRRLLIEGETGRWSQTTEILLFTAARRDHIEQVINPARARGDIILCDRFIDSTRAYQGTDAMRDLVERLHAMTIGITPDLSLIFDMEPQLARTRTHARGEGDRFEKRGLGFQQNLRQAFLDIAAAEPERCRIIAAEGSQEKVAHDVWQIVAPHLGLR